MSTLILTLPLLMLGRLIAVLKPLGGNLIHLNAISARTKAWNAHGLMLMVLFAVATVSALADVDGTRRSDNSQPAPGVFQATPTPATEAKASRPKTVRQTDKEKKAKLARVKATLLDEFVGWDEAIERIMSAAESAELFPEMMNRPIVIPLIGFPGYGKTTLVQRFLELMEWPYAAPAISKGAIALPTTELKSLGRKISPGKRFGKEGPPAVMVLEEVQRIKPEGMLDKTAELLKAAKDQIGPEGLVQFATNDRFELAGKEAAQRSKSHEFWWDVLGNGVVDQDYEIEPKDIKSHMKEYTSEHDKYSKEYWQALSKLEAKRLLPVPQEEEKREAFRNEIDQLQLEVESAERNIAGYENYYLTTVFIPLRDEHPELLGSLAEGTPQDFLNSIRLNRKLIFSQIEAKMELYPPRKKVDYRRLVVFVLANPDEVITQISNEFIEQKESGRQVNPDTLHALAKGITQKQINEWFFSIFGRKPGWASRMQLSQWNLLLPFDNQQWMEMIRKYLTKFDRQFQKKLNPNGKNKTTCHLEFDDSVIQMLFEHGVAPIEGPRDLYALANQTIPNIIGEVYSELLDRPKSQWPEKVFITYDPLNKTLNALTHSSSGKQEPYPVLKTAKVGLPSKEILSNSNRVEVDTLSRQAYHQAGHAVLGALLFGSLPEKVSRADAGLKSAPPQWWESHDNSYEYNAKMLMALMGGYSAETLFLPAHFTADQTRIDRTNQKTILAGIVADLQERARLFSYADERQPTLPFESMIDDKLAYLPLYQHLKENQGDLAKALQATNRDMNDLLRQHEPLVRAIANKLMKQPHLSAQELKQILVETQSTLPLESVKTLLAAIPGSAEGETVGERSLANRGKTLKIGFFQSLKRRKLRCEYEKLCKQAGLN